MEKYRHKKPSSKEGIALWWTDKQKKKNKCFCIFHTFRMTKAKRKEIENQMNIAINILSPHFPPELIENKSLWNVIWLLFAPAFFFVTLSRKKCRHFIGKGNFLHANVHADKKKALAVFMKMLKRNAGDNPARIPKTYGAFYTMEHVA